MKKFLIIFLTLCLLPAAGFAQNEFQAIDQESDLQAEADATGETAAAIQTEETAPPVPVSLDQATMLVIAEADLYVDKASLSFSKGDMPKAERALRKASAVLNAGLETAAMKDSAAITASAEALVKLADSVSSGEIKTAEELDAALAKGYRELFK